MDWSNAQQEFVDVVGDRIKVRDSSDMAGGLSRWMHIAGGPGTGNTEAVIHAAYVAVETGCRVLILCPTGALAHSYKERLPNSGRDVAFRISYCPEGGLGHICATGQIASL